MSSKGPVLLIVSSPSGAGKTTLTRRLFERVPGLSFSVSHTTRAPRAGEKDGREYHFVTREHFEERIRNGELLEWAEVHGNLYGTAKSEVVPGARGIVFDIDYQGARQLKAKVDAVGVFILPPSMEALLERLRGRASESDEAVQARFGKAQEEIEHHSLFDYVIVNDDLHEATERLVSIFLAEECRVERTAHLAEELLTQARGFGGSTPPAGATNER